MTSRLYSILFCFFRTRGESP